MLSPSDYPVIVWYQRLTAALQVMEQDAPQAQALFEELLGELRGAGSGVDELTGLVLGRLAECCYRLGDFVGTIEHSKIALELYEARGDLERILAHNSNLIALYARAGEDRECARAIEYLIALRETFAGADHDDRLRAAFSDAAKEMNNRAGEAPGQSARARALYETAIRLARLAGADEQLAKVLYNFASLLMTIREDLGCAEQLLLEARFLQERVLRPDHPDRARILNNLGALYQMLGDSAKAYEHYRGALEIASVSTNDGDVRATLRNLVHLGGATYDDSSRKIALERLAKIDTGTDGDDEWRWVSQLSDVYLRLGNVKAAEAAVLTLAGMAERRSEAVYNAVVLHNLAAVRAAQHRFAEALPLYQQSITMLRGVEDLPPQRLSLALANVGQFLNDRGRWASAVPLLEEALEIDRHESAVEDIQWSWVTNNLALAYLRTGREHEGLALMEKVLEVRRRLLPEGHSLIAQAYFNLGVARILRADDLDAALPLLVESLRHEHLAIENVFAVSSEEERLMYLETARACLDTIAACLVPRASHAGARALLFDATVQRKGLVADRMVSEREAIRFAGDPRLASAMAEMRNVRHQIARILFDRTGARSGELAEWTGRKRDLERMLAERVPGVNLAARLKAADRSTIAEALPPDSALIEFIAFGMAPEGSDRSERTEAGYLAFILPGGNPEGLSLVVIGLAESVHEWVETFRGLLLAEVQTPAQADAFATTRNALGDQIRRIVLDPIRAVLGNRTKLFLAPDGVLNRFPFHTLPDAEGRPLCETWEISYLDTGRDLLRLSEESFGLSSPPVVVADPDYDLGRVAPDAAQPFFRLLATRREGREVAKILGVEPWTGEAARKSRIMEARSPHILHLATHGFSVDAHSRIGESLRTALAAAGRNGVDEALLRSGLALAGANTVLNAGTPAEDGLLFAYDILSMDLSLTALVVLSACDTGLGEYQKGEGVYGLRRAFMVVGARSQIVTLWSVPDTATTAFMIRFYTELSTGASRVNAMRTAQREVRDRYGNAYSWGAFVLFGDPGPLPSTSSLS
jgi:CHAT domain-containing protein/tetratricopeptide (TPR) repeat protein